MDASTQVGGSYAGVIVFVATWTVMMAMMLPSATPLMLLYRVSARAGRTWNTVPLAAGYLLAWAFFGVAVYLLQLVLTAADGMMVANLLAYGVAGTLLAAGVYQFTPLKDACLRQCRSPVDFLVQRWRPGSVGALRLGIEHGL